MNLMFGDGDLIVGVVHLGGPGGAVQFTAANPGAVGRCARAELDAIPPADRVIPVRMLFPSVESLDVVIEGLRVLRDRLAPPPTPDAPAP